MGGRLTGEWADRGVVRPGKHVVRPHGTLLRCYECVRVSLRTPARKLVSWLFLRTVHLSGCTSLARGLNPLQALVCSFGLLLGSSVHGPWGQDLVRYLVGCCSSVELALGLGLGGRGVLCAPGGLLVGMGWWRFAA